MKIRCGFVSNSSSSSFIIYGVSMNEEDILQNAEFKAECEKTYREKTERDNKKYGYNDSLEIDWNDLSECDLNLSELLDEYIECDGFHFKVYEDGYELHGLYAGRNPNDLDRDETRKEFGEKIVTAINEKFGTSYKEEDCDYFNECWENY